MSRVPRARSRGKLDYNQDDTMMPELVNQPGEDLALPGLAIVVYGADWEYVDTKGRGVLGCISCRLKQ